MNIKNNKKAQESREKLQKALFSLIKSGEQQITIKRLCEVADVNRTTFYAHFDSIEEVLYEMCSEYIKKSYKIFINTDVPYKERIKQSLLFLYQNGEFFYYAFEKLNNIELCIMHCLEEMLHPEETIKVRNAKLSLAFIVSGFVGIGKLYFNNFWKSKTNKFTLEEASDILCETINQTNKYLPIT